jgi:RNA polymerase sigma-70 factor (ECF subfamily)
MIGMRQSITCQHDDADAAGQLVERYGDRVYRLAIRITGTRDDAEDVTQDALGRVARAIGAFTRESEFGSWIERITATAAYRKLCTRPLGTNEIALDDVLPPLDSDGHFEPMDDWSTRFAPWATPAQLRGPLTEAIDALPADYRMALILRDSAGWSNSDIAETLGLDLAAVMSRVHRARLFVRRRLAEYMEAAR